MKKGFFLALIVATFAMPAWAQTSEVTVLLKHRDGVKTVDSETHSLVSILVTKDSSRALTASALISRLGYNIVDEKNYSRFTTIMRHSGFIVKKDGNFVNVIAGATTCRIHLNKDAQYEYPAKIKI